MPSKEIGQKTNKDHKAKPNASGGGHIAETSIEHFINDFFLK